MAMVYRARPPAALNAVGLTHGQRELARWARQALGRGVRLIAFICLKLLRRALRTAVTVPYRIAWEAWVHARAARAVLVALWRRLKALDLRRARDEAWRELRQFRAEAPLWATVGVFYVALISLPTLFASRADHTQHRSIRELAIEAQQFAPPPCSLTDGQVWVLDDGRYYRPGRPGYEERRRALCGF